MTAPRLRGRAGGLAALLLAAGIAVPLHASATTSRSAAAESAATAKMRMRIFGAGYDKPDQVRLKWVSITTWIGSFGGHVLLFDSTVMDHLQGSNATPYISLEQVIAAKPEAILQNHTHLDQMRHASRIAAATGAKLITTRGGCLFAKREALEKGLGMQNIHCDLVRDAQGAVFTGLDSYASPASGEPVPMVTPFGTIGHPEAAIPGLEITVENIKHSQIRPYTDDRAAPYLNPDVQPLLRDPATPQSLADFGLTQDIDNGNLLYKVNYRGFTVVHHGSSGSLNPLEPGQQGIREGLRKIAKPSRPDVEIGGIAELTYTNGFVESRRYAEELGAKVLFPAHHNNWLPPVTSAAAYYYQGWTQEMRKTTVKPFPSLCFVVEKNMATAFSFTTSQWAGGKTGPMTSLLGPGCYSG